MAKIDFGEIAKELLLNFLVFFGLMKTTEDGKKVLNPEGTKDLMNRLAPHIFGIGLADEALFNTALAKLEDRRNVEISRFLETLSNHDRARFILAITLIPEEKDRITILNWYSELSQEEMVEVAQATHMITGTEGILDKMGRKAKAAAIAIGKFMAEKLWPLLQMLVPELDRQAETLAQNINQSCFGRIANRLFR